MKTLTRETFETRRESEYFTEKELRAQIGHGPEGWPLAILRELIDNSLDACEMSGVPPEISVTADHAKARPSLGRLIRQYQDGKVESQAFRDIIYAMNTLLAYFRHEADIRIETRLDALEDQLSEGNGAHTKN